MNRLLGYSLLGLGALFTIFLLKYKGGVVPMKELWFVLSLFTMVAGGYFFAKYKFHKLNLERSGSTNNRTIEIYNLKRTGQKVKVTLENSEVNTRTFQQEIINEQSSKVSMLDALYDSNRNYKSEEIKQTYIVYCQQIEGKTYKFISQPTPHEPYIVKSMIVKHRGVDLYIDPKNPGNYYFDLPYL